MQTRSIALNSEKVFKISLSNRSNCDPDFGDYSDGENPIPRHLRDTKKSKKIDENMSTKRKIAISSDSEDDMPVRRTKKEEQKKEKTASPAKKRTKPVVVSDESDGEKAPKQKKLVKKPKRAEESEASSTEDELVRGNTEKKKKKSGKKELPTGQKTLNFMKKAATVKADEPKKRTEEKHRTPVNPADFFKTTPEKSPRKEEKLDTVNKKSVPKVSSQVSTSSVDLQEKKPEPTLSWVDKYKPKRLVELVGQVSNDSPMNKLMGWLKDWARHNLGEGAKIKKPKPAHFIVSSDGTPFKAALLSGSPGVGKTTCAYMACQQLGLELVEMNASDVRNKKCLEAKVGQLSGSHQIEQFFGAKQHCTPQDNQKVHHVLIMDEVDGMSGNEDRAGISELIQIIKDSKIPIICICNDRQHPKIRSLANHCFDLRFQKPRVESIRSRMMTICSQERLKITKEELDELIELSGHDVRQTIYNLQMRSKNSNSKVNKKNEAMDPFQAARHLLDPTTSLMQKQEMFFVDYGIMPLFVQENYINMRNDRESPRQTLHNLRKASDFISLGDLVDKQIRAGGSWKLLNEQSMLSAALPAKTMNGPLHGRLGFPSWLGKNSTAGKRKRLLQQLVQHTHLRVSASGHSFATDYAPMIRRKLTKPLLELESEGIPAVIETMTSYDLIKDDGDALSELVTWPGGIDPASKILGKVKGALTRNLNKMDRMLPYSMDEVAKGKRKGVNAIGVEMDADGNLVEKFEDEDGESDEDDGATSSEVVVKTKTSSDFVLKTSSGAKGRGGKTGRGGGRGGRGAKK
ncbi:unnamed protein product [Caenorhabditis sp. 36 PRJEB53466]|nr:unnamed protein product [Caenorhabditis sp. 36 PRJEB53466]